jgi:hypothetical protein
MQTVTTFELRDAFAAAIRDIVPTAEPLRAVRWSYVQSPRKNGRAVLPPATRTFDLIMRDAQPSYTWVGGRGSAYVVRLAVATSYAGVEPELREHLVGQDSVDLRRALRRLIDPVVGGLVDVAAVGTQNETEVETTAYVEHAFLIHYHQATA